MTLFQDKDPPSSEKIQLIRHWVRQHLSVESEVPISISQLQCHEPCCPPVETVISIMTHPVEVFKIHRSIDELKESQVRALQSSTAPH